MLDAMAEHTASTLNKPDVALEMTLRPSLFSDFTGQPRVEERLEIAVAAAQQRAQDIQLRVADVITKFAGSMMFVYIHIVGFALWMLFVEKSPWEKLTLIVSLEAIFLSTFVMIAQKARRVSQPVS